MDLFDSIAVGIVVIMFIGAIIMLMRDSGISAQQDVESTKSGDEESTD